MKGNVLGSAVLAAVVILTLLCEGAAAQVSGDKFLQTFSYRIGGSELSTQAEVDDLAKFDHVVMNRKSYNDVTGDLWGSLRTANPDIVIFLYQTSHQLVLRLWISMEMKIWI